MPGPPCCDARETPLTDIAADRVSAYRPLEAEQDFNFFSNFRPQELELELELPLLPLHTSGERKAGLEGQESPGALRWRARIVREGSLVLLV